ncbi:hypothetical protein GCM10010327_55530 [Streptomyces nitrosporeus]|nr:hypothetical protein GCM10010327_55530 [Streptomyces nitrosporeus]
MSGLSDGIRHRTGAGGPVVVRVRWRTRCVPRPGTFRPGHAGFACRDQAAGVRKWQLAETGLLLVVASAVRTLQP